MAEQIRRTRKYHDEDEVTPRREPPPSDPGVVLGGTPAPGDDAPVNQPDPLTGRPPDEE